MNLKTMSAAAALTTTLAFGAASAALLADPGSTLRLATGVAALALTLAATLTALATVLISLRRIQHDMRLIRDRSQKVDRSTATTVRIARDLQRILERGAISHLPGQIASLEEQTQRISRASENRITEQITTSSAMQLDASKRLAATTLEQILSYGDSLEQQATSFNGALEDVANRVQESTTQIAANLQETLSKLDPVNRETLAGALLNEYKQLEALITLYARLRPETGLPAFRDWAVSPDLALRITDLIADKQPDQILEVGSGTSTVVAAQAMQNAGHGHITALEQDAGFADATIQELKTRGLLSRASVIHAPLVETQIGDETWRWYDLSSDDLPHRIDLLIVDGPPASTGPMARYPAVPLLKDRMAPGATVIVDDTLRPDDRAIVERWLSEFSEIQLTAVHRFDKGSTELERHHG